jgi:hypothetical protein
MKPVIKNLLISFAVVFAISFGLGLLERMNDVSFGTSSTVLSMGLGFFTFFILHMMSGNRKEVRADNASRQASLSAVAPSGHALLYVYREGFMGKAVGWNVSLDGAALAQLRSPRFTQTAVSPGIHTLAVALSGFAGSQNKPTEMRFEAQSGEVIVFAMKSKMGALSNTLSFEREQDPQAALQKFSKMPMVAAERGAGLNAA